MIVPYHTHAGNDIELLSPGIVSAKDMFESELSANAMLTWVLRVVGWIMMIVGFSMTNGILYTIGMFENFFC